MNNPARITTANTTAVNALVLKTSLLNATFNYFGCLLLRHADRPLPLINFL